MKERISNPDLLGPDYIMYINVSFKKIPCCALENESVQGDVQTIYG